MPAKFLTRHLESVDESYFEHFRHALSFSGALALGAGVCFVHAVAPFLFEQTGSNLVRRLHQRMVAQRTKASRSQNDAPAGAPARSA